MNDLTLKRKHYVLQIIRAAFAALISILFASIAQPGTPAILLALAAIIGVMTGGAILQQGKKGLYIGTASILVVIILTNLGISILEWLNLNDSPTASHFAISLLGDHINLLFLFFALFATTTTIYWCFAAASLFEIATITTAAFYLMKGHQNYAIDAPKAVADLAWKLQIEVPVLILIIGSLIAISFLVYLFLSEKRPLFLQPAAKVHRGERSPIVNIISVILPLIVLSLLGYTLYNNYQSDLSRASNGVGENKKEGESPLGFHSAVGKTKQPAALVRLQSDFLKNPWTPMLYIREGALSEFNGRELVNSSPDFDQDVPRTSPAIEFQQSKSLAKVGREEMSYSVYFLKAHNSLVAIDYPTVSSPIVVPDDERFVMAYKATSLFPTIPLAQLHDYAVGEKEWSEKEWQHYLRAPGSRSLTPILQALSLNNATNDEFSEDLRYKSLSTELTAGLTNPMQKAIAIVKYLSDNSIYTRTPGHTVTESGDPVAAYLFADEKRGYCVHFSHAAVYLMRLAGIPARIGTGYLTDLRYAKDGHILLHLGDRHAWPEVYVENVGWVVVDVTPAKAENEEELIPDEQLLDDLISKIDPIEEFLPKAPEVGSTSKDLISKIAKVLTNKTLWSTVLAAVLLIFISIKLWLREGYRLGNKKEADLRKRYRAAVVVLADLGLSRLTGETRREFAKRVSSQNRIDLAAITALFIEETYSPLPTVTTTQIKESLEKFHSSVDQSKGKVLKVISVLSPRSLLNRSW